MVVQCSACSLWYLYHTSHSNMSLSLQETGNAAAVVKTTLRAGLSATAVGSQGIITFALIAESCSPLCQDFVWAD